MRLLNAPKGGPVAVPAAYAAAAKAKLKRDRDSYRAFREVDQREHERAYGQRVAAAVAAAEEEVRLFREDVELLEPEAAEALKACREAEDAAREAREYARQQREAHERVKDDGKASAQEKTDALIRADAAEETAHHAGQVAASASEELRQADQALAEVRDGLTGAERELDEARKRAQAPVGTAPISDVTIRACTHFMQADEVWDQLSEKDRFRARQAGEPRDMKTMDEFWAEFRAGCVATGVA